MKLFQKTIFATTVMLITIVSTLSAQPHTRNLADVVLDPEYNPPPGEQEITSSGLYRWGEGEGATLDKAKERARHDLATKIQAFIQSTQTRIYAEEGYNTSDQFVISSKIFSVLQIQNLQYLEVGSTTATHHRAIAYITNSDFDDLVQNQKEKVREFVQQAELSLDDLNIGDCLKNYYWAFLLTHTLTDTLQLDFEGKSWNNPKVALLSRLNTIIERLQFRISSVDEGVGYAGANVIADYQGNPVNNLPFSYYSGLGNDYGTFQNGKGYVEKYSEETLNDLNKVKIHLEYAGESGMRHHSDLMALYEIYKTTPLENAWKTAYLEQNTTPEMEESEVEINKNSMIVPRPVEVLAATDNLESFLSSLRSYTKADKIMLYGNQTEIPANEKLIFVAIVPGEELVGIYYKSDDGFVNIKTDEIITTFEGKYTGARQIWMVINE